MYFDCFRSIQSAYEIKNKAIKKFTISLVGVVALEARFFKGTGVADNCCR